MNPGRRTDHATLLCAGLVLGLCGCAASNTTHRQGQGSAGTGGGSTASPDAGAQASPAADGGKTGSASGDGAVGSASSDGAVGMFVPRSDLDKTAKFDWTESLPGQGTCKPGKYTGTFMCDYKQDGPDGGAAPDASVIAMVSGPVTLTLQKSMSGEFLEISDGKLDGVAMGVISFSSMLSGRLDCTTLKFSAKAVMGSYALGGLLPLGTFDGSLIGMFDTQTLTLKGEWALKAGAGSCRGPWTASYTP